MGVAPATATGSGAAQPSWRPWCNPQPSGDLRGSRFARPGAVSLHKPPDVDVHLQIANGLHHTGLESGLWRRGPKQTVDDLFGTSRCEADLRLGEVVKAAVEAVLDRTVIHVPEARSRSAQSRAGRLRW